MVPQFFGDLLEGFFGLAEQLAGGSVAKLDEILARRDPAVAFERPAKMRVTHAELARDVVDPCGGADEGAEHFLGEYHALVAGASRHAEGGAHNLHQHLHADHADAERQRGLRDLCRIVNLFEGRTPKIRRGVGDHLPVTRSQIEHPIDGGARQFDPVLHPTGPGFRAVPVPFLRPKQEYTRPEQFLPAARFRFENTASAFDPNDLKGVENPPVASGKIVVFGMGRRFERVGCFARGNVCVPA